MYELDEIPFRQLIEALLDSETPFGSRFLYRLSDLEQSELEELKAAWPQVPLWRRRALLEDVEALCESDLILSFTAFAGFAALDADPKVRLLAVRTLWEYEATEFIPLLMSLAKGDQDAEVRAAATGALGPYVFLGEIEELPAKQLRAIEDLLLEVLENDKSDPVRRFALEALGFSGRKEVSPWIEKACRSRDDVWIVSALIAMGRSANEAWHPMVLEMLENRRPGIRSEAARAAGELDLREAVPLLIEMIDDPDDQTRLASIWSLSQIGGEDAREALLQLYNELEDDQELEFVNEALENLDFSDSLNLMPFLDFPDVEDEDLIDDFEGLDDDLDEDD
jgi:HEAT repeat protein